MKKDARSYYENFFLQKEIPLPEGWGGIALIPSSIEFWQMQDYRLHDRLQFYKKKKTSSLLNFF